MRLEKIVLENFRNHKHLEIPFQPRVNLICGRNGVGKTNILEAIYFAATSKSHRNLKEDNQLILHGEQASKIKLDFFARSQENFIHSTIALKPNSSKVQKSFACNYVPIRKSSDLMGFLSVVFFSPDDLQLVKGGPHLRRRLVDLSICQMSKTYIHLINTYCKILDNKNKLLKFDFDKAELEIWNEQLIAEGEKIQKQREQFAIKLNDFAKKEFKKAIGLELEINYRKSDFANLDIEKEIKYRQSLFGPHRDDLQILIDGEEAKIFASQGQIRTAVVAIKLAQTKILEEFFGESPILLLDDVMSELDRERQHFVLNNAPKDIQIIITKATQGELLVESVK